jgi:TatD DNase family protein
MWIDSHCHLDAPEFDADRAEVIARARAAGVGLLVIPSVTPATFATAREPQQCNGVYALGIHPLYVDAMPMDAVAQLADALQRWHDDPRLVAVGEIGMDGFVPQWQDPGHRAARKHLRRPAGAGPGMACP